ncbi:MAG: glycosyltransferase family 4 protein [Vicinamibacteria bacterium]
MKLLVVAPSLRNTSPGSRFRVEQWIPYFEAAGVSCTYAAFEDETLHELIYTPGNYAGKTRAMLRAFGRRVSLTRRARDFDLVFLFEEAARIGPALLERAIRWLGVPLVYDFCDPIYLPYRSPMNHHLSRLKCIGKTASICRLADHVIVGNDCLAEYARRYNPKVSVVPITIDTRIYKARGTTRTVAEPPVIGWSGSHSTVPHLDTIRPVLQELARLRRFRLLVVGAPAYRLDGVDCMARPWSAAREIEDLHEMDIGVMPLPDDTWSRLRSHLKVRQYMGAGIPAIASPATATRELIQDGVDGYLAEGAEEWLDRLARLIDDPGLRLAIGRRARATIEERYSGEIWAARVLQILNQVLGREGSSVRPERTLSHKLV